MTDLAILESQFEDHKKESSEKYKSLIDSIKTIELELKNRVTFATFSWTLGILMTVVLAYLTYIANQVATVSKDLKESQVVQYNTQSTVANIQGILKGAEITK